MILTLILLCAFFGASLLTGALAAWTGDRAHTKASWYGEEYRGRLMANGRPFDPDRLTCASWDWPLGTRLLVRHAGRTVCVEITDRGPSQRLHAQGRALDLSRAAFARLADPRLGVIPVAITVVYRPAEEGGRPAGGAGRPDARLSARFQPQAANHRQPKFKS